MILFKISGIIQPGETKMAQEHRVRRTMKHPWDKLCRKPGIHVPCRSVYFHAAVVWRSCLHGCIATKWPSEMSTPTRRH